jgi:hypothetical protein
MLFAVAYDCQRLLQRLQRVPEIAFIGVDIPDEEVRFGELAPVARLSIVLKRRDVMIARNAYLGIVSVSAAKPEIARALSRMVFEPPRDLQRLIEERYRARQIVVIGVAPPEPYQDGHLGPFRKAGEFREFLVLRYYFEMLSMQAALF